MNWYTGNTTFDTVLTIGFVFAALTIIGGAFMPQTPYGRFGTDKWGMALNPKFGWWLMEIPATVVFLWFYLQGPRTTELVPMILAAVWLIHYANHPRGARAQKYVQHQHRAVGHVRNRNPRLHERDLVQ